ncbi:YihY/virulence factor BrkB family protein [Cellulomonas carbonis]|uniref:Ribonuclease BN n=1 Tax=Cellulomonas carbonis T26 TaxID=947969 RepID=A0A0A0BVM3_9CELL|nr:YihY/virulence factor BrkB family protein [Cellulomonas carbonis]KGM11189.1 ribonuclease BN [Cellulomonas carbonis T26]GGC12374.1 ribonuclease [Cellulomonas carbonis]
MTPSDEPPARTGSARTGSARTDEAPTGGSRTENPRTDHATAGALERRHPGAHATSPREIPLRGWWQVVRRAVVRSAQDRVPLVAAGVAFFGFLAIFPTLIAAVLLYGLVADPTDLDGHVRQVAEVLPPDATRLVGQQLTDLVAGDQQGFSVGLVVSLVAAVWSASVGVANLVTAVNMAYEETERVGFVKRRLIALAFTLGAVVTFVLLVALVAVVPVTVTLDGVPGALLDAGRWLALAVVSAVALAGVYRFSPERRDARLPWVTVGAVVATVLWLLVSAGFSLYVTWFASYSRTYGALAGVVVLLVWMWLTSMAVLLGAEVNAEAEHQTDHDTTVGPWRARGERDAVKADTAVGRPDPPDAGPADDHTRRTRAPDTDTVHPRSGSTQ